MTDPRGAEVKVLFISDAEYRRGTSHYALRMSRLEFEALRLRAAQQEKAADSHNARDYTFTLGGNVYTHEYLMWLLSGNHRSGPIPTQQQWAEARVRQQEAQQKAEEEKRRRAQEQARQAQEAYYRASQQGFWYTSGTNTGDPFSRMFHEFNQHPQGEKPQPGLKPEFKELARLAGVEWKDAIGMKVGDLKKKAMRKCHPDTGGSHEKWLELTKVLSVLGMKL